MSSAMIQNAMADQRRCEESGPALGRMRWRCPCGALYRVSGSGRHRIYWSERAPLSEPVMDGCCVRCGRALPGKQPHCQSPEEIPARSDDGPARSDDGSARSDDGPARSDDGPARSKAAPQRLRAQGDGVVGRPLRVAMLAPPWIPVPPPGYGGIEAVVELITRELVRRGHHVTLFAAPGSRSEAEVVQLLDRAHPDEIERSLYEADHVARAFAAIDEARRRGRPYDVLHDHCGFTAFAMADRVCTPVVHTLHGPFTPETSAFYAHHARKAEVVAISHAQLAQAPRGLRVAGVVPNPIDAAEWPLVREKEDYLLWVGRMTAEKGPHRAIAAAQLAGMPLVLAGPVQPGQERFFEHEVAPRIDGRRIRYLGEIAGEEKKRLFSRARALLMPIRWPEPFGMVMLEAMVCGTPVIAFPEGSARELVVSGRTGLLVEDEEQMAEACSIVGEIDPASCREVIVRRCDARSVAASYERLYSLVLARATLGAGARLGEAIGESLRIDGDHTRLLDRAPAPLAAAT